MALSVDKTLKQKGFSGAPFGVQTKRFVIAGLHPKITPPGHELRHIDAPYDRTMEALTRHPGPGMYKLDQKGFHPKAVEERAQGPGWARQYEVECIAAMPHLLYKDLWLQKQEQKRKLGPGTYNFKDFLEIDGKRPVSVRGILDNRAPRFARDAVSNTPGPGTYGVGGIPQTIMEEKNKRSTSTRGMLEAQVTTRWSPTVGSNLGPGTYNTKSMIDELTSKMTSLRGPYDLFSGERNKPIIVGHLAAPRLNHLAPGQYDVKSGLEEWSEYHRKYKGKFSTLPQFKMPPGDRLYNSVLAQYPRDESDPGPGSYYPQELSRKQNVNPPGFMSSADRVDRRALRFFTGNFNSVGAGRYDIQKFEDAQQLNGHQSAFKSKSRRLNLKDEQFLKERLHAKLVPPDEKNVYSPSRGLPGDDKPGPLYTFQRNLTDPGSCKMEAKA